MFLAAAQPSSITDTGNHPFAILVIVLVVLIVISNRKGGGGSSGRSG